MKPNNEYTIAVGKQVVIWITSRLSMFIAEVTKVDPLRLKVMEAGPYAKLKEEDYILLVRETITWQADGAVKRSWLFTQKGIGRPVLSGLASLGVTDELLHEIVPQDNYLHCLANKK